MQQRDPLDKGFSDKWGLHLLSRLLQWDPRLRITAQEVTAHANATHLWPHPMGVERHGL